MKYLIFATESEALTADAQISASMGLPRIGTIIGTGEPDPSAPTLRWAIPRQILDGRWVIPSPDDGGVDAEPGWWTEEVLP
jgi:hypothetical protein